MPNASLNEIKNKNGNAARGRISLVMVWKTNYGICYEMNCVLFMPKLLCGSSNPQCDGVWRNPLPRDIIREGQSRTQTVHFLMVYSLIGLFAG